MQQRKMDNLTFVMCNLKLTRKRNSKTINYDSNDIQSDDEWITDGRIYEVCIEKEDDGILQPHRINENIVTSPIDVDLNVI